MEKAELQKSVEALRSQLKIERVPVSKAAGEFYAVVMGFYQFCFSLKAFCEANQESDPLVYPIDKKHNPWAEKSKCAIL